MAVYGATDQQCPDTRMETWWTVIEQRISGMGTEKMTGAVFSLVFMHYRLPEHPEVKHEKDENKYQYRDICRFIPAEQPS